MMGCRKCKQVLQLLLIIRHRSVTYHIFSKLQGSADVFLPLRLLGLDINYVYLGQKAVKSLLPFPIICLHTVVGIQFIFVTKRLRCLCILRKNALYMKTADIFCLPHDPIVLIIICNYTHGVSGSLTAQLGAGNILGTLQVHHITVILKVVKFAAPVRTKYQKVYLILDDIAELLPLVLLDDDLICKTGTAYILNPFQKAVPHVQLTTLNIVALAGHAHDQIIAQCFRSF